MITEKRKAKRVAVNHELAVLDALVREYATNVSSTGAFIRTGDVLPIGTPVELCFSVIVDDFEQIRGRGVVARAVELGDDVYTGIGIRFSELEAESKAVLGRLLGRSDSQIRSA